MDAPGAGWERKGANRGLRPDSLEEMANRLAAETSPYLLQHADNPVDWYPWAR